MPCARPVLFTLLAMIAFAGNSILCRMALNHTGIDAATFTSVRLVSGAITLRVISTFFLTARAGRGNWLSAFALFVYAAGFSFAYLTLTAATGALLLFCAVQVTMIGHGIRSGERLSVRQAVGMVLAFCGLVALLLPGLSAPPLAGSVLMLIAGVAWGVYSLRGKGAGDPTRVTAGNFLRGSLFALLLSAVLHSGARPDVAGLGYAIASGAIASGLGYALWYAVLPALKPTSAATVQLSVPVIAAFGGVMILGEPLTVRLVFSSAAILGGIALVTSRVRKKPLSGLFA